ncbi:hypothetical protein OC835_001573, partial [Tilletia horrida]
LAVTLIKGGQFDGTIAALDKALLSLPAADAVLLERELAGPTMKTARVLKARALEKSGHQEEAEAERVRA